MSTANRKYKDSVFVDLFSEDETAKENFLSLYNALHNTSLGLSCSVEKIQSPTDRYLRKLTKIPSPEFYVFYNGKEDCPETDILKLSDAFITIPNTSPLELIVKVYNINKGKGAEVLSRCKTLAEYSLFVEEVRSQMQLDSENGFTNAVKICIEKGILKDYLQRKAKEVINMLIAEYDYDTDIAVQRQESLMLGIQQGIQQGMQRGFADGSYQKALETAKLMKQKNLDVVLIKEISGLSPEEIEKL